MRIILRYMTFRKLLEIRGVPVRWNRCSFFRAQSAPGRVNKAGRVPESQTPGGEITDPWGKKHLSRSPFFHWKKSEELEACAEESAKLDEKMLRIRERIARD